MHCEFALDCYKDLPHVRRDVNLNLAEWISWHLKTLDKPSLCLLLTTCWKIWEARNQKLWRNICMNTNDVIMEAKAFLEAWNGVIPDSQRVAMEEMFQNHNEGRGGRRGWEKSASALSTAASAMEESCGGDGFRGELPRDRRLWP
nr:uncharacterized protein LOC109155154 [Ipomoea trifida]